ncbi:hypothetical protein JX266_007427 [Neoarthrinium moseri]|nr:hypothetical protein JX266_007427 [Neoarthrinium moseri]
MAAAIPPVTKDKFAYANGDLLAEASGSNRHQRMAVAELKKHFQTPGSGEARPAHWYEAQLLHYGLAPSKNKSVARMRLFDAVSAGGLRVPARIARLEAQLRREWNLREREATAPKATATRGGGGGSSDSKARATPAPKTTRRSTSSARRAPRSTGARARAKTPAGTPTRRSRSAPRQAGRSGPSRASSSGSPALPARAATPGQAGGRGNTPAARAPVAGPPPVYVVIDDDDEAPPPYSV